MKAPLRSLVAVAGVAAFLAVAPAGAEEITRASYRAAVEPICEANTRANERILKGVRRMVRRDMLGAASLRFLRAAGALRGTLGELRAVPPPPADSARIFRWLGFVATEARLFERTGRYLEDGRKSAAEGMVVRLESVANRANNVVFAFEFEYCRLEPSRFT
jgi:hypothetical protein